MQRKLTKEERATVAALRRNERIRAEFTRRARRTEHEGPRS